MPISPTLVDQFVEAIPLAPGRQPGLRAPRHSTLRGLMHFATRCARNCGVAGVGFEHLFPTLAYRFAETVALP